MCVVDEVENRTLYLLVYASHHVTFPKQLVLWQRQEIGVADKQITWEMN